jgi:phage gp36-like protein
MACTGAYATSNDFAEYWCITLCEEDEARLNRSLKLAATRIHAARAASGGCDCTLADWASEYLMELNILIATVVYNCKCTNLRLTDEAKAAYQEAVTADLTLIREGKIELCASETGSDFPYSAGAELGTTEYAQIQIILNDVLRNS